MHEPPPPLPTQPVEPLPTPLPRRRRRWPWFVFVPLFLFGAMVIAAPYLLQVGGVREEVERGLSREFGVPVKVGRFGFDWISGVFAQDVQIGNPPDFDQTVPAVRLAEAWCDISLLDLLRGRLGVEMVMQGLEVHVEELGDGRLNLAELGARMSPQWQFESSPGSWERSSREQVRRNELQDLRDIGVSMRLERAVVQFVREGQLVERLDEITATVDKQFGADTFELALIVQSAVAADAAAVPGRVELRATLDPLHDRVTGRLTAAGVDLARYQQLLTGAAPDELTIRGGTLNATVPFETSEIERPTITTTGVVTIEHPSLTGSLLHGADLRGERWQLRPELTIATDVHGRKRVDLSQCTAELGFATLRGLDAESARLLLNGRDGLGCAFDVDLTALAAMGPPLSDVVRADGCRAAGTAALPFGSDGWLDVSRWRDDLCVQTDVTAARATPGAGFELTDLRSTATLRGGAVRWQTGDGSALNGGPLRASLDVALDRPGMPFALQLQWQQGRVNAPAAALLRYAVPLLAGGGDGDSRRGTNGDGMELEALADLTLTLQGNSAPAEGEPWLQFLDGWSGGGTLQLQRGLLTPAAGLRPLLAMLGETNRLPLRELSAAFTLNEGDVTSTLQRWAGKAGEFGIRGKTRLEGAIDYEVDLRDALARRRDGQRLLAALGDAPFAGRITGTLDDPRLALPDLGELMKKIAPDRATEELRRRAGELIDEQLRRALPWKR